MEGIVLGGGCFWCVEGALKGLRGVSEAVPGYSGGHVDNPTYEQVCGKRTGHAEVVMITYDPGVISRRQLFDVFFCIHASTQLNRQGNDVGPQYRSIILYSDQEQREEALAVIEDYSDHYTDPIVTEVVPLERFWPAENYHIDYYSNNPKNPYCQMVVSPKLAKARAKFSHLYE